MRHGLRLADPSLVVLVGPSASGKSTWAREHFAENQVVSSDRLRAVAGESEGDIEAGTAAFALLETIVATRLGRRLTTVVDTLGTDPGRRARWLALAAAHRVPAVAVIFDTPAAECRRRNAARTHRVPQAVLDRQLRTHREQRELVAGEGFEVIAPEPVRVVTPEVAAAARVLSSAEAPAPPPAGDGRLRFGLHLSAWDVPGGPAELGPRLADVAARAEAAGFSSVWVMDHLRQIPQVGRAWEDMPESTATLGYLAAATSSLELGCLVSCVTFRNVAHLGKIVATLDVLSGGRAWCGLGAGWFEAEHLGYGWPFPPAAERLDVLEDALQLLPMMWGPGSKPFHGRRIDVPETICYPRPLRAKVPILVGGSGEQRTLRLVARYADACNLMGDAGAVAAKLGVLRRHCAEVGRDPATVEVTHLSTALVARRRRGAGGRRRAAAAAARRRAVDAAGEPGDRRGPRAARAGPARGRGLARDREPGRGVGLGRGGALRRGHRRGAARMTA